MNDRPFLDTNVLVYASLQNDPRAEIARGLLLAGGVFSVHILNEFVAVARRKLQKNWKEIRQALASFRTLCPLPVPITVETHDVAIEIAERYRYHIYDSLVIAAAIQAHSKTLYSEDLRDGQTIRGLTICNPF